MRPERRTTESALSFPSLRQVLVGVSRAARLRCPHCGGAPVLARWRPGRSWGAVHTRCAACGFRFERSDDRYFGGAMFVNLMAAEFTFFVGFVTAILVTWPDVPWDALTIVGAVMMLALPALMYPVSKVLWLAVDVLVRPVTPDERT